MNKDLYVLYIRFWNKELTIQTMTLLTLENWRQRTTEIYQEKMKRTQWTIFQTKSIVKTNENFANYTDWLKGSIFWSHERVKRGSSNTLKNLIASADDFFVLLLNLIPIWILRDSSELPVSSEFQNHLIIKFLNSFRFALWDFHFNHWKLDCHQYSRWKKESESWNGLLVYLLAWGKNVGSQE